LHTVHVSPGVSVQALKNHLRLIRGSMILDHIETCFLGGDLYARATYRRVYTVSTRPSHAITRSQWLNESIWFWTQWVSTKNKATFS